LLRGRLRVRSAVPERSRIVAKGDRRKSNKMRRRKAQSKKKERIARRREANRKPAAKGKKS
jgi:hypothetical protein